MTSVTFEVGAISGSLECFVLPGLIIDDDRVEYDERFSITLIVDNPLDTINGGSAAIAEVTILDNDGKYKFEILHHSVLLRLSM